VTKFGTVDNGEEPKSLDLFRQAFEENVALDIAEISDIGSHNYGEARMCRSFCG